MLFDVGKITSWVSGNYLVLIRDTENCVAGLKSGFGIQKLQIGNLEAGPASVIIHRNSRLSKEHLPNLIQMLEGGLTSIYSLSLQKGLFPDELLKTLNK